MKLLQILLLYLFLATSCATQKQVRVTEDFNAGWKFNLADTPQAAKVDFDDADWERLDVPHDWSIEKGYQKENTAASTGFVIGGIAWYRKSFQLPAADQGKKIRIVFDGVYNNSSVWINGHFLGERPNGYASFAYDLTDYLKYGNDENVISVKVDHSAYIDSRWYSGSGIYRKVQLIKTAPLHLAQWGVQITTPKVSQERASVEVKSILENPENINLEKVDLKYSIFDPAGKRVVQKEVDGKGEILSTPITLQVEQPRLWDLEQPNLYTLKVEVLQDGKLVDETTEVFGIRFFEFDADQGFSLNGKRMKIKGVNLHHDAGAVGAAVPKAIWEYRVGKLKAMGTNAIRLAHNPHSVELLEVCDEMGILVMNEAFDEWNKPKGKNLVYIGDNAAPAEPSRAYPEKFDEWAERDLKDLIRRDFNHPSVIMWSIGNEIEWTFPYYSKTYEDVNGKQEYFRYEPDYDAVTIRNALQKNISGVDTLTLIAKKLTRWVKEMDTTRPVTCGSVQPSIGLATGYGQAVDVFGFNYRAMEYDAAHRAYPDLKILGSENWGAYSEWKNCVERDFVAGIFLWTGFAYLGEAGPFPRKGLDISLFDFAGFKNPRGHFFECLWKENPKVYLVTTPAAESEFSYDASTGWKFEMQYTAPPVWSKLRLWEWYKVYEKWKYQKEEPIVVQTYTNCEAAELFLNGTSLGKQKREDFAEDNIIKWLVPFQAGELKVVGYNDGKKANEYLLNTTGELSKVVLQTSKKMLTADGYDVAVVTAELRDENNNLITDKDRKIEFEISGAGKNIGIDNGWEKNVQSHRGNSIVTHHGRALLYLQTTQQQGTINVGAKCGDAKVIGVELVSKK